MERRLAAILAADVVGYSRLMGEDEAGTLERLKSLRRELVQPKIAEGSGRIVKLMADGLLAEFPSVVEAVRCAVDIQQDMAGQEADSPSGCTAGPTPPLIQCPARCKQFIVRVKCATAWFRRSFRAPNGSRG